MVRSSASIEHLRIVIRRPSVALFLISHGTMSTRLLSHPQFDDLLEAGLLEDTRRTLRHRGEVHDLVVNAFREVNFFL